MEFIPRTYPQSYAERAARERREKMHQDAWCVLGTIAIFAAFIVMVILWFECKI